MVVILLLTPSATNGCDTNNNDESNDSTASTTSTATTAIPASHFYTDGETKSATAPTIPIISKSSPHIPKNIVYDKKYRKKYRKPHNVSFEFDRPQQPNAIPKPPRRQKRDQPKSQLNEDKNYVRHVTRVNFSDYYDSQVEVGDGEAEAVTKEEEWVTKRKTELTTTRQIETRVKRQVVLEDGKVIEDSGPIVSTNTTEDTEKQESESTERRNLGEPDVVDGPEAIDYTSTEPPEIKRLGSGGGSAGGKELVTPNTSGGGAGAVVQTLVARPDGLVREIQEKRVISREEVKELVETEDVRHLGDFSDEAFVQAVNSGVDNLEEVLYSPEHQQQLVPLGPRLVRQSVEAHKTIDTEDTEQKSSVKPDGTIVTEKKKTTEHEEIFDEELPEKDDQSTGSREKVTQTESSQRYYKQRDEQNVEYVADGKVIGKEMRYAAETEQMERDGPPEGPDDWDSLSDRVRKQRRIQKSLLQQQKEAALMADRTDAITKLPLDFDREEETRKGETMKWLESHFGSESTTSSHDGEIEPTKKTFFNVTIKSNQAQAGSSSPSPTTIPLKKTISNGSLSSPSKVIVPERDSSSAEKKYFQGISNWNERKESTPLKHFASKAFHDELKGTLEKNKMRHARSRDDIHYSSKLRQDDYVTKEDILQQKKGFGSRSDLRYRKDSREDSDDSKTIRAQREDLGYLSGSRTDLRYRRDSKDDYDRGIKNRKTNGYLKREDSGYVKDSREDVRSSLLREVDDEREKYKSSLIQRDDSAYVSSSTYFTETRPPKTPQLHTPDSGIRSPSPDIYDTDARPTVPQRKRAIEKRLHAQKSYSPPSPIRRQSFEEPPPDYSPPPRSRSASPTYIPQYRQNEIPRKPNQRTRFASESSSTSRQSNQYHHRPAVATQTTQTQTPSTPTPPPSVSPPKQGSKVGQAIGNSIRKLVGKIRSASAERKFKIKSKSNRSSSRQRSPSPSHGKDSNNKQLTPPPINGNGSTYQQYNVIDSHIVGGQIHDQRHQQSPMAINRESSVVSSSTAAGRRERERDRDRSDHHSSRIDRRGSSDLDMMTSPKQRYYLGEDPYGGSIYGKENKYDGVRPSPMQQYQRSRRQGSADDRAELYQQRNISSSTLGRFSKSVNRLGSTPNLDQPDYRSTQTLPRKLDHHQRPNHHSSTINVSIVNTVKPGQPTQNTGPAKPARTYKSLNRSKSFNVHGMNGTNDPSPIYMEKLTRNNYTNNMYKSNPHLNESGPQLKSPSIVNLISRSQKDLTRIDEDHRLTTNHPNERRYISNSNYTNGNYDKRNLFLKGLQDQAPELYKTLHGDEEPVRNGYGKYPVQRRESSSLGSRSPIEVNKDTASIIRRGSSSTDDYSETYKITTKSDNPNRPSVTNTVHSYTKKTVPTKSGRGFETIQSSETKSVTTSRYRGEPTKYGERRGSSTGPVVIEVRNGIRK